MEDKFVNATGVQAIKVYIDEKDLALQEQLDALGEPFRLMDFNQTFNVSLPNVGADVANTSIPNIDVALSDDVAADFAIAGLVKYEVYDAAAGGNRINAIPVCTFSMNGQKTLRVRMMVGGSAYKTARRIQGAVLLKHR